MIADDSRSVKDRAIEMATSSIISKADPEWDICFDNSKMRKRHTDILMQSGPCPCKSRNDSVNDGLHPTEGCTVKPKTRMQRLPDRAWSWC